MTSEGQAEQEPWETTPHRSPKSFFDAPAKVGTIVIVLRLGK